MKIKFLGAAGTVTGSSYVLTSGRGQSILIDLGMFQGLPEIDELNYKPYDYDCSKLSASILTHAHLDHCGRLPILLSKGFKSEIWMTPSTRELTELSLLDSAKIAIQDDRPILYDKNLAMETFDRFKTVDYRKPVTIGDFTVTFRDAGHILGSASLEIVDNHATSQIRKIVFSGDLGNSPEDLVQQTELLDNADVVVMESTYGDRLHPDQIPADIIQSEINTVEKTGAALLMPAFSLERTQELLHIIMHLKKEGKVSRTTPVYLDSPMAKKATDIYLKYSELFNEHALSDVQAGSPFYFPGLKVVEGRNESRGIQHQKGAKVIIAGSGMMMGGRILSHAAHYLPSTSTRLLIVGYQGEGTIGRALMEGATDITIDGKGVHVNAAVNDTQAMSSHADQGQLLAWLKHIKDVRKVVLTHGEDGPREALSQRIKDEAGIADVAMPRLNQELELT